MAKDEEQTALLLTPNIASTSLESQVPSVRSSYVLHSVLAALALTGTGAAVVMMRQAKGKARDATHFNLREQRLTYKLSHTTTSHDN